MEFVNHRDEGMEQNHALLKKLKNESDPGKMTNLSYHLTGIAREL
jgi:hypothetical protein